MNFKGNWLPVISWRTHHLLSFILGNYFFASHILSTMCWWLMAEVDLKPIPVTPEPKVWPCHSYTGWHCTNVEPLCASTSFSVPVGMTFSLKLLKVIKWDSTFEVDMSTLKECREWPVWVKTVLLGELKHRCQYHSRLPSLISYL